jgi:hypothetical protein
MVVKKEVLINLIEPMIYDRLENQEYEIVNLNSSKLLTWNRLITAFNLYYLKYKNKNKILASTVYKEMIRASSLGTFIEPGQEDLKNNIEQFFISFEATYEDIKKNGFDPTKTLIPLANNNSFLNGSHRIGSSVFLKQDIWCVKTNLHPLYDDWKNLYERNMPQEILEIGIKEFLKYTDNVYCAFLWPSCSSAVEKNKNLFKNILYKKKIKLTSNGAYNLLIELYKHMDEWAGTPQNNFKGIKQKLIECFPQNKYEIEVILFQELSLENVRVLKEKVRKNCNIGYSSVHITDTKEEVQRIGELILNDNGMHFLNYAYPYKYFEHNRFLIEKIKTFIELNNIDRDDFLVDSSTILSLYGIRKNVDIDYLLCSDEELEYSDNDLEEHSSELIYQDINKEDLVYDPKYYFIYQDIKFLSFFQLYRMKENRGETKDKNDCMLMKSFITNDFFSKLKVRIKQNIFYAKIKIKHIIRDLIIIVLKKLNLYTSVKNLYQKFKKV